MENTNSLMICTLITRKQKDNNQLMKKLPHVENKHVMLCSTKFCYGSSCEAVDFLFYIQALAIM